MHIDELKESKYLTKHDVEPELIATITGISKENLAREGEPPEYKYILNFKECKPLVLNSTNGQLAAMALESPETDDWEGRQITMYNDRTVSFGGKLTGGIRIRPEAPNKSSTQAAPTQSVDDMNDDIPF
jgi:hypothetical protein